MSRLLQVRKPSTTEMHQLRDLLEENSNARVCRWAESLLCYGAGLNASQIAAALAVHVNTIYNCLNKFANQGLAFLQCVRRPGVQPHVTAAQLDEIAHIADQAPTEFGLPYGRWSLAKLREYLISHQRMFKRISREHLRRLLKKRIFGCATCNASSSVMTPNAMRFWLGFVRLGDTWRVTAHCSFSTSNPLP
jgi:transposase